MASSKQEPPVAEDRNYITNGELTERNIRDMKLNNQQKDDSLLNHVKAAVTNSFANIEINKEVRVNGTSLNFNNSHDEYEREEGGDPLSRMNGTTDQTEENVRDRESESRQVVTCSSCEQSFQLQSYMEHKCPGRGSTEKAPEPPTNDGGDDEGDMESFQGEILYQEDGSAYLVDNSNLPYTTDNALKLYKNALGVTPTSRASPMNHHRLVNALHIPTYMTMRNLSQLNISLQGPYGTPMVHSFRVYDVRNSQGGDDSQQLDGSDGESKQEEKAPQGGDTEFSGRPILMCFLCKLSFGLAKSFLSHATQDHQIELHPEEERIMSSKVRQSAIIQGAEKEPLLSFLELITTKAQKSEPYARPSMESGYMPQFLTSSTTSSAGYMFPTPGAISTMSRGPGVITSTKTTSDAARIEQEMSGAIEKSRALPLRLGDDVGEMNSSPASTQDSQSEATRLEGAENSQEGCSDGEDGVQNLSLKLVRNLSPKQEEGEIRSSSLPSADGSDMERRMSEKLLSPVMNGETPSPDVFSRDQTEEGHCEAGSSEHAGCSGGKNCNVECPKCDAVLSSSRSLGGHMTMMHSRNSCKTLKCPKCNWHYKYQQTLEAHMKEKHPDDETKCVYCENQEAHPRLSRGESYTCGYKPYRCAICNYSTTTKGNLSIHMQSDKHLNNVQELQTGGEHNFLQAKLGDLAAITKPKQKQTWRCEACDYETSVARNLNIHMTSQKHIQNMMTIHQNVSQMQRELQANLANISPDESLYVAMTQNMIPMMAPGMSESTASAVDIQQLMANYQYDPITYGAMMNQLAMSGINPLDMAEEANTSNLPDDPSKDEPLSLFHCAVCNRFSTDSFEALFHHVQRDRSEPNTHLWKMVVGDTQQCTLCNYSTQVKANFQLHLKTDKHSQKLNLFNHIREGGRQNEWRLKYMNVGNPVQVRCNACDFYTHSVDKLCSHCHPNNFRHESNMKLFRHLQKIKITYNVVSKSFRCSLCNFVTKNKLSLVQHVQSNHQKESDIPLEGLPKQFDSRPSSQPSQAGEGSEAALDLSTKEPATLAAAAAESKIVQEAHDIPMENVSSPTGGGDETSKLMKMFQQFSLPPPPEQRPSEGPQVYACPYCKFSTIDKESMTEHVVKQHSLKPQPHLRCPLCQESCTNRINLEVHLMEKHSVAKDCVSSLLKSYEPAADFITQPSTSSDQMSDGPLDKARARAEEGPPPPTTESKGNIPQETEPDCIDLAKGGPFPEADAAELYRCQNCHKKFADIDILFSHQERVCPLMEQDTPRGPGFLCWKRGCNQYFKSPTGLRTHFREIHHKHHHHRVPTYNIAAYKFKCSQCTLAFRSRDKLMEHDRIHSMVKCIACHKSFPSPSVLRIHIDTVHSDLNKTELLQYYNTLPRIREALGAPQEELLPSPPQVPKLMEPRHPEGGRPSGSNGYQQEGSQGHHGLQAYRGEECPMDDTPEPVVPDEESYYDPAKKYKCHRCIVGFARQSERAKHERTLQHKNEQNYMMDRYFDPKRPHKCDLCRESFTQKSILLSHLNSVSHLHRLKQSLNEPGDPDAEYLSGETKPYRCKLCKVSYSTHTTLDTHFRCVLHQSRVKKREAHMGGSGGRRSSTPQSTSTTTITSGSGRIPKQEAVVTHEQKEESSRTATPVQESREQKQLHAQMHAQAQMQAQQAHFQQLQFQQLAQMQSYQQAYLQQQIAAHLTGSPSGNPTQGAGLDPNALISPELAMMAMAAGFPPNFYHPMSVPTCSVCSAQFATQEEVTQHHQQAHGIKKSSSTESGKPAVAIAPAPQEPSPSPVSTPSITVPPADATAAAVPVKRKRSSAVQRKLLASYGFDLVQQFNEFAQGLPQSIASEDKYQCKDCPKEFSSIWVFKAHVEEMHKQILDIDKVEQYAQVFRDELLEENGGEEAEPEAAPPKVPIKKERMDTDTSSRPSSADLKRKSPASEESKATPPPPTKTLTPKEETLRAIEKLHEQANNNLMMPPPPSQPQQAQQAQQLMLSNAYQLAMLHAMQQPFPGAQPFPGMPPMHQLQPSAAPGMPPSQQMPFLDPNATVTSRPGVRRGRTRISEDQLKVLKAYFNISNSPADDQIMEMSLKTGLPNKVIKHWFRNTLFKERQKNKDSPYNFNNPPTTTLSDAVDRCKKEEPKEGQADYIPKKPKVEGETATGPRTALENIRAPPFQQPEPEKIKEALIAAQAAEIDAKKEADKKKGERLANIIKTKIDMKKDQQQRKTIIPSPSPPSRSEERRAVTPPLPAKIEQRRALTPPPVKIEESRKPLTPPPPPLLARAELEGSARFEMDVPTSGEMAPEIPQDRPQQPRATSPGVPTVAADVPTIATAPSSKESGIPSSETETGIPQKAEESVPEETGESGAADASSKENVEMAPMPDSVLSTTKNAGDQGSFPQSQPLKDVQQEQVKESVEDVYAFESDKTEMPEVKPPHKDVKMQQKEKPLKDGLKSSSAKEESRYDLTTYKPSVSISSTPTSSISDMASPLSSPVSPGNHSMSAISPPMTSSGPGMGSNTPSSRRSGRTRFTDYQIKVLQEFFESNAYPRDEDVEHLSRLLNLNGRVIVVWFQNARQKARKIFENQPPPDLSVDPGDEFRNRDTCLSYQCNKCSFIFQRFHDLIKHQKHLCTGSPAPVKAVGSSQPLTASVPSVPGKSDHDKRIPEKLKEKEQPHHHHSHHQVAIKKEPKACEKCNITFASAEEWQDHQQMHLVNMGLFGSYFSGHQGHPYMYMPYEDSVNGLTPEKYMSLMNSSSSSSGVEESAASKRKYSETSEGGSDRGGTDSDHHRDKRLRTTITPAQLDILYSKYQEDSNPTRRMLDMISHEVGLKKRVVQVWFQNTRARERKGQFRISALQQARKCPFCDETFKSKNAMETHARMRHFDQYSSREQLDDLISQAEPGLLSPHSDRAASTHSEEGFDGYGGKGSRYMVVSDEGNQFEYGRPRSEDGRNSSHREDTFNNGDEGDKFGEGSDELDVYTSEVSFDGNASDGASREAEMMSPTSSMVGEDVTNSEKAPSETGSLDRSEDSVSNCDDSERGQRLKDCSKRYRTHMTQFQLKVLKHCFADYRTPIMQECELLGQEVGLQRRVVQVWFQNSRAKEKKVKSNVTKQFGLIGTASDGRPEMCTLCGVRYAGMMSVRDHIFTEQHIRNVKRKVRMEMEKGDNNGDGESSTPLSGVHKTEIPGNDERLNKLPSSTAHPLAGVPSSSAAAAPLPSPGMSASQMHAMQAMQAHLMPPFPPQIPFPVVEEKKPERGSRGGRHGSESSSKSSKEERKSERNSRNSQQQESKHRGGSEAAAASPYGMMPNVSAGDAALMSYLYGGLAPYYAQMPMMYPVYPMGAEMFYAAQDPAMQAAAAFSPHLLQAYAAGNPLLMQQMQQHMQQAMGGPSSSSKGGSSGKDHKAGGSAGSSSAERKNSLSSIKEMELILKPNSSTNRYLCKRCEKVYTDLESVTSHQVTSCFLGQVVKIEETVEKLPSNRFLCQVCPKETLITDEDVLKHLHSFTHQQRAFLSQYEMLSRQEVKKEK